MKINSVLLIILFVIGVSCNNENQSNQKPVISNPAPKIVIPDFDADSAWSFVNKQVSFGPRVPGTVAHAQCAEWMTNSFKSFGAEVFVQDFKTRVYTGKVFSGKNIIASFNPLAKRRIMLSAHWDSRPYGDHDANSKNHYQPIDGANDGASGVGILLEIARQMQTQLPAVGVDIMLWDLEDYGEHKEAQGNHENSWGLGSQYWSANPHKPGYRALYGILLDMVGAENPTFYKEYYSKQYASAVLDKVWSIADKLGYGNIFINDEAGVVMDDHYYINTIAGIPTIDIIHYNQEFGSGFFPQWHTAGDNMDIISKSSLKIVGHTLLNVIYQE